ncbi:hypothetical protein X798_07782 [Onchocerca flexuosa]|uniref:Uncharacterized protein n=1 Tax=Onchocerca flexuosa TaxID=387005 RepID=A0A238BIX8_9BILA|nr:hypothetical protein X798_07782 [Onchocerca flexuosa]
MVLLEACYLVHLILKKDSTKEKKPSHLKVVAVGLFLKVKILPKSNNLRLLVYFVQSTTMIYMDSIVLGTATMVTTRKCPMSRNK